MGARELICLHNSKDRGDTLENCGRGCGVCFVPLFPISHRIMRFFPLYFRPDPEFIALFRVILLQLGHVDAFSAD